MLHAEAWEEDLYVNHSKSYLYLKLALLGMSFKLVFACWYEASSFPDKRVLGTFQFSRLTSIHTCNQISSPLFFLLREELSLVDMSPGLRLTT